MADEAEAGSVAELLHAVEMHIHGLAIGLEVSVEMFLRICHCPLQVGLGWTVIDREPGSGSGLGHASLLVQQHDGTRAMKGRASSLFVCGRGRATRRRSP